MTISALRVDAQRRAHPQRVAEGQVLRLDRAAVRGLPAEDALLDARWDAAPDHGRLDACRTKQLWHLPDVAELVGQIADRRLPDAELARPREPELEIAKDRLA